MFGMASLLKALGSFRYVAGIIAARRPPGKAAPAGTLRPRAGLTARANDERGRRRPGGERMTRRSLLRMLGVGAGVVAVATPARADRIRVLPGGGAAETPPGAGAIGADLGRFL